jgi:hypothetical protein
MSDCAILGFPRKRIRFTLAVVIAVGIPQDLEEPTVESMERPMVL